MSVNLATLRGRDRLVRQEPVRTETDVRLADSPLVDRMARRVRYQSLMEETRSYLTVKLSGDNVLGDETQKETVRSYIIEYLGSIDSISDKLGYPVDQREQALLAQELLEDISGYGVLDPLVRNEATRQGIEEVNINAWNDIEVYYRDGSWKKSERTFVSANHALSIIRKILPDLNDQQPIFEGNIDNLGSVTGLRIAAAISPIVDETVRVTASIRFATRTSFTRETLVKGATLIDDEFGFLKLALANGISVLFSGATGSGKTATLEAILAELAEEGEKRVLSIEEGSRELNLVRQNEEGHVTSRTVHMMTRPAEGQQRNFGAGRLVRFALREDPDIMVVQEIRGPEANSAQEAAKTGHAVATTLHAPGAAATYSRFLSLCFMEPNNLSEDMMMAQIVEAFPLVVFMMKLPDNSRKVMSIIEAERYDSAQKRVVYRVLYEYVVQGRSHDVATGAIAISGQHIRRKDISDRLAYHLLSRGVPEEEIQQYAKDGWSAAVAHLWDDEA